MKVCTRRHVPSCAGGHARWKKQQARIITFENPLPRRIRGRPPLGVSFGPRRPVRDHPIEAANPEQLLEALVIRVHALHLRVREQRRVVDLEVDRGRSVGGGHAGRRARRGRAEHSWRPGFAREGAECVTRRVLAARHAAAKGPYEARRVEVDIRETTLWRVEERLKGDRGAFCVVIQLRFGLR